jgi:hypothetical protein
MRLEDATGEKDAQYDVLSGDPAAVAVRNLDLGI